MGHQADIAPALQPSLAADDSPEGDPLPRPVGPRPAGLAPTWAAAVPLAATTVALLAAVMFWRAIGAGNTEFCGLAAIFALVLLAARGTFEPRMIPDFTSLVPRIAATVAMADLLAMAIGLVSPLPDATGRSLMAVLCTLTAASLIGHGIGAVAVRRLWCRGKLRSRAIIVGDGELSREFAIEILHHPTYGIDLVGFIAPGVLDRSITAIAPKLGDISDLRDVVPAIDIDRVLVAPLGVPDEGLIRQLRWAATEPSLTVQVVPRFYELGMGMDSLSPDRVRGYPLMKLQRSTNRALGFVAKRAFDTVAASAAVVVLSPILIAAAIAVGVSSPGPVLFKQERVGRDGRRFMLYKFRSMRESVESDSEWMGEASQRITTVGAALRRFDLDELPQLFNVVRGDMALVGPRPERPQFVERFSEAIPDYDDRHRMPAGLTGLAQIVGLRGDTPIAERVKYDNLYIDQWSFVGDLQIIVKTVWAVIRQDKYVVDQGLLHQKLATQ